MTVPRLIAILFIFACVSAAWWVLAGVTVVRTTDVNRQINPRVQELWGPALTQAAPMAYMGVLDRTGKQPAPPSVQLDASDLKVDLHLDYRQKGLLWYSTYTVGFDGQYRFVNPTDQTITLTVQYVFPAANTLYDNFKFEINGAPVLPEGDLSESLTKTISLGPREPASVHVTYRSRGVDSWLYKFGDGITNVKNFKLAVNTDFRDFDFPAQTVSSSEKTPTAQGWALQWNFDSLVAGFQIGVEMPKRTQPGPLASQMSFFAPISLLFFYTVLVIIGAVRGQNLHPMHYFFLGAAFFSFHLLFAYLADHLAIELAFAISAIVSLLLVVTYVGRVMNWGFALRAVGIAQFLFLILFSYAFFYEGYTGLVITIGAIITLAVMMQVTAKVNWEEVFSGSKKQAIGEKV
ncbi:MAG: inner membrane CreD family protein [Chloroflexota bacterium]|nr:inner membrane CreD family protein [Chloroflexota bacterium]